MGGGGGRDPYFTFLIFHKQDRYHWRIQGVPLVHAPHKDPFLSFSHTFLPKSVRVRGCHPPQGEILDPPLAISDALSMSR